MSDPRVWQPIETVPKDGSEVLLGMADNSDIHIVAYWDDETETPPYYWATLDGPGYHENWPDRWMTISAADAALPLSDTPAGRAVLAVVAERFPPDKGIEQKLLTLIAASLGVRPVVRGGKVEFEAL